MRLLFVPLIVLVVSWLSSHLVQNTKIRAVLKSFSWIYALMLLWIDLVYFLSVALGQDIRGAPASIFGTFWIPSAVYLAAIPKRYRLMFPDSKFLKSNKIQILFCALVSTIAVLQAAASAPLIWLPAANAEPYPALSARAGFIWSLRIRPKYTGVCPIAWDGSWIRDNMRCHTQLPLFWVLVIYMYHGGAMLTVVFW